MSTDYNIRASKGQAFNLAVAEAINTGRPDDTKFIYQRFVFYFELAQLLQDASLEDIKTVIDEN